MRELYEWVTLQTVSDRSTALHFGAVELVRGTGRTTVSSARPAFVIASLREAYVAEVARLWTRHQSTIANPKSAIKTMARISEQNRNDHYDAILATAPQSRARVFLALADAEPRGLTRFELAQVTKLPVSSICGRVNELEKTNLIVETDEKRDTPNGGTSVVLRIADHLRVVKQMTMF